MCPTQHRVIESSISFLSGLVGISVIMLREGKFSYLNHDGHLLHLIVSFNVPVPVLGVVCLSALRESVLVLLDTVMFEVGSTVKQKNVP